MKGSKHIPTKDNLAAVECLSSFGHRNEEIAEYIGISSDALVKHYSEILQTARLNKVKNVSESLYQSAMKGNVGAQIFFLKTVGRWRTEDSKLITESNADLEREMKELRAKLDAQNRKDY